MNDTICGVSTAVGIGAISIIRISGKEAIKITNKIFKGKDLNKVSSHTINYGHIIENGKIVDEVLVSIMKAPKTYTMENIVEINCHGSIASVTKILELLISQGCRLAEPGEFTKRAFLNGRIDLLEAESVMDVINSKTEANLAVSINQLTGSATKMISNLRNEILNVLAQIEVKIDYPEYDDISDVTHSELLENIENIENQMNEILEESKTGKIIKEGIKTSIIGKPNVGKSSILNKLLEEEKAIVTPIAGTTRDIVEGTINIDGILLNIIDTAGIRKTNDLIENIGVNKSINLINDSDMILFVVDNSKALDDEDLQILEKLKNKNYLILINKIDLKSKIDIKELDENKVIKISAKENIGIIELKKAIKNLYNISNIETRDLTYLTSARSISLLKEAKEKIPDIKKSIQTSIPIDIIEIDIKSIWDILGKIIGETYEDELIDKLFSSFCLGK
ncbi:MAG: tRNA uridine-5-carboxymethylaminomethyl(34) synthesis GTPase MnmE [Clostridium sp.]|nr:tRNA uridine-5-carboxymethylaminomethyl(34) synthesis GTPase MnmE [Clostridium sp.]MCM1443763.1 tRNA uridine-5-carboxymethylaminomethyl(34) synthesis GTPase MnmE [Candidatus Amulumruptor caecigallinarius]